MVVAIVSWWLSFDIIFVAVAILRGHERERASR